MKLRKTRIALALGLVLALAGVASAARAPEWSKKKPGDWTIEEVRDILTKSPWVKTVEVFPAAIHDPASETKKPTATGSRIGLFVRWYSAGIIRQATVQGARLSGGIPEAQAADMTKPIDRFYILSLTAPESLSILNGIPFEKLAADTTLKSGDQSFPLVQVVRPEQTGGPEALFFFDRADGIPDDAKKATFKTKIGDADLKTTFDLTKMTWDGKRDLDGDTAPVSAEETRRREIQSAVLDAGDADFARAVSDVRVEKKSEKGRTLSVYVFYDPGRELSHPAEARMVDIQGRKLAVATNVGAWSKENESSIEAIIFVDPAAGKAVDYVLGVDAEKLPAMKPDAAKTFFKSKLQKADAPATKKSSKAHPNAPKK